MIIVRFVSHPGPFDTIVRLAQLGHWATHVDMKTRDGRLLGARYEDGVQSRPIGYDEGQFSREEYINIKATEQQTRDFYNFLDAQIGKPYDVLAIIAFMAGRDWRDDGRWFCSELFAAGCAQCGKLPREANEFSRVTVRDARWIATSLSGAG